MTIVHSIRLSVRAPLHETEAVLTGVEIDGTCQFPKAQGKRKREKRERYRSDTRGVETVIMKSGRRQIGNIWKEHVYSRKKPTERKQKKERIKV